MRPSPGPQCAKYFTLTGGRQDGIFGNVTTFIVAFEVPSRL